MRAADASLASVGAEGAPVLHPSAYAALRTAAQAALTRATEAAMTGASPALREAAEEERDEAAAILEDLAARALAEGGEEDAGGLVSTGTDARSRTAPGERGGGRGGGGGGGGAGASAGRGRPGRGQGAALASASFVLEGAQVVCGHGENASSPIDIFLTRDAGGEVSGTVDIAREARGLVYRLQRRQLYAPVLSALPASRSGTGGSLSAGRRRRLLSQHAEKKALAAQLALGYPEARMELTHRMCADCHAFFKAASRAEPKQIVVRDARVKHTFENGQCSCGDTAYGGGTSRDGGG